MNNLLSFEMSDETTA